MLLGTFTAFLDGICHLSFNVALVIVNSEEQSHSEGLV